VLSIVQLNFEEGVGLLVDDGALRWNQIVSSQIGAPLKSFKFRKSFKFKVSNLKFLETRFRLQEFA
jgi:hypothetical protein